MPLLLAAAGLSACGAPPPTGDPGDTLAGTTLPPATDPAATTLDPAPTTTTSTTDPAATTDPTSSTPTSSPPTSTTTGDGTTDTAADTAAATTGAPCEGLECQVDPCGGDPGKTTLRGTVYAPEGTLPLYGVSVSVPNAPLAPLPEGVQCDTCAGLDGDPVVAALTDTKGEFVLTGVPAGAQIPLVISSGKWRRTSLVPVAACADNLAPAAATRLPRDQSEGHLPRIALTTGGADPLECLLRKLGIDDAEFTPPSGPGRVNLFAAEGGSDRYAPDLHDGAPFPEASVLWGSLADLMQYDIVLMACEGNQYADLKSQTARENMVKYAGVGGRLFLTHWHNVWIEKGPAPWPTVAQFKFQPDLPDPAAAAIDTGFPKGQALAAWMVHVGGSPALGQLSIAEGQHTIVAVNPALATRWIYTEPPLPASVQHLSFNAPVGAPADKQCGRVVDSDIHVSSGDQPGAPFPGGCTTAGLTPQEKVLAFMFFELSACLIPDDQDPIPG